MLASFAKALAAIIRWQSILTHLSPTFFYKSPVQNRGENMATLIFSELVWKNSILNQKRYDWTSTESCSDYNA